MYRRNELGMKSQTDKIPLGFHAVTPCLTLKDSLQAIAFCRKAFGAEELEVFPTPDGKRTMHAAIRIGDSSLMMGDETPEQRCLSAESLGGSPIALYIYVSDVDTVFQQAVEAGAAETMPVTDMFWDDRCGTVKDPFGYSWTIATHTHDMTDEEVRTGAREFLAETGKPWLDCLGHRRGERQPTEGSFQRRECLYETSQQRDATRLVISPTC
jgi:PhnB protein